jgi:hypothetical protein
MDGLILYLYIVLTLELAIMARNNYKEYKRPKLALLYGIFSVVTFISALIEILRLL